MSEDLETQPLLPVATPPLQQAGPPRNTKHHRLAVAGLLVVALLLMGLPLAVHSLLPDTQTIQDEVIQVSQVDLSKVHIDGWTNGDGDQLDDETGRYLQMTAYLDVTIDYGKLSLNSSFQKHLAQNVASKMLRTICIQLPNVTTFDNSDILGTLKTVHPICISLKQNHTTHLQTTILVEPNMHNILHILKKLWKHDYDNLHIWSDMTIKLYKQNLPLATLHNLELNWDKLIKTWNDHKLHTLRHWFHQITIQKLELLDTSSGFHCDLQLKNEAVDWLPKWLEISDKIFVPRINWQLVLPDCQDTHTVRIPKLQTVTPLLTLPSAGNLTVPIASDIEGPLPEDLINHVCWSDEENIITPMTKIINKIFNSSELLNFQVNGTVIDKNSTIPPGILNPILHEIARNPLELNVTVDESKLIEETNIDGLKIKWIPNKFGGRRLRVVGKLINILDLSFYNTSRNDIAVKNLKGDIQLFSTKDNKQEFLNIPIKVWTKSKSFIYHSDGDTLMQLEMDINDNDEEDIEVVNSWELTKFLNEIMINGEAKVHIKTKLDIMVDSKLGEIVLMGLQNENDILVKG